MQRVGLLVLRTLHARPLPLLAAARPQELYQLSTSAGFRRTLTGCLATGVSGITDHETNFNPTMSKEDRLIWVDLEMTGLDVDNDHILEMACIVTDGDMNIIAEGPDVIVHHPDSVLEAMGPWCKEHHGKSGLTEGCKSSRVSLSEMEEQMLSFVQQHTPQGKCPLAGNTIHMDKRFLDKYLKRFSSHLHYRIVDVSSIKELCRRWYPRVYRNAPHKKLRHRALDDIRESISELKYYKENVFKPQK